ncbi:radical SAM protein, partial [Clostridium sp. 2-1]|uniref:radical SAM protein n=1 Tax=Clostridium sp. 2-1 TaxID=2070758 RepID=UPI00325B7BCC
MDNNPEENVPKVLSWLRKFDKENYYRNAYDLVEEALKDPQNNWYRLIMSLYTDIDAGVRKKTFENFIIHASIIGCQRKNKNEEKYNCNIPWAILMDPTSACNLHCTGCWAADYGNRLNMDYDTLDRIIEQGKALGTYMYIYSGGEPLVRKNDIIRLCEKHSDCEFLAFTNGTLIDEAFA